MREKQKERGIEKKKTEGEKRDRCYGGDHDLGTVTTKYFERSLKRLKVWRTDSQKGNRKEGR